MHRFQANGESSNEAASFSFSLHHNDENLSVHLSESESTETDLSEQHPLEHQSHHNPISQLIHTIKSNRLIQILFPTKLGIILGVYVPNLLNTYGVILFLRFAYLVGIGGLWWNLALYLFSYGMNLLTTLSLSALATNGKMQRGGPYYIVSRVLGAEFGFVAGFTLWISNCLSGVLDLLGCIEATLAAFPALRFSPLATLVYSSAVLFLLMLIAAMGASIFSKFAIVNIFLIFASIATMMVSLTIQRPGAADGAYTGWSMATFKSNMSADWPEGLSWFWGASHAFGILYPATSGFLAGFNLSGDLSHPNRDLPRGTVLASFTTFVSYMIMLVLMCFTLHKDSMINNTNIMGDISVFEPLQVAGIISSTLCAAFMSFVGCSRILQALGRDKLFPFSGWLGCGIGTNSEPIFALLFTWICAQAVLFTGGLNFVAPFVSLFFILVHVICNLSCLLLHFTMTPNFRPSFKYFNKWTSLLGVVCTTFSVFFINPLYASIAMVFMAILMMIVHFFAPPKSWGNLMRSLITYQTRRYNVKLDDRNVDHIKFWRLKLLLLASNPRSDFDMLDFFSKITSHRGGLPVIANIDTIDFREHLEIREKENKAFHSLALAAKWQVFPTRIQGSSIREGARILLTASGLSLMQPNTLVLGFYGENSSHQRLFDTSTKQNRKIEAALSAFPPIHIDRHDLSLDEYMELIKDTILLKKNLIIGRHFHKLSQTSLAPSRLWDRLMHKKKKYIDLWILCLNQEYESIENSLSLMMQLAYLMNYSGDWHKFHKLRVTGVTDEGADMSKELKRINKLLQLTRIDAKSRIIQLRSEDLDILELEAKEDERMRMESDVQIDIGGAESNPAVSEGVSPVVMSETLAVDVLEETVPMSRSPSVPLLTPRTSLSQARSISIGNFQVFFPATVELHRSDGSQLTSVEKYRVLNHLIRRNSHETNAVIISMPPPPVVFGPDKHETFYMEISKLTEDLPMTMLVYAQEQTISLTL